MEKIILAVDATPINTNTLNFACYLAKLTGSSLTGVFLQNRIGEPEPELKAVHGSTYVETVTAATIPENKVRAKQCEENILLFETVCEEKNIKAYTHLDKGNSLWELINESRYADLLVIDAHLTAANKKEEVLTLFMKEVLATSECPVVIAPYSFSGIDEIIFAYDGSKSSVFAIKQFNYLFPQLSEKRMMVVQVNAKEDAPVIEKERISELLRMRYSAIGHHFLQGKAGDELFGYLLGKKNVFVVMGAYGSSVLPVSFRRSTADTLVRTVNLPLFIAHH